MNLDVATIVPLLVTLLKVFAWGVVGAILVGGLAYYLFVVKQRRKWKVDLYELRENGKLELIDRNATIFEKKIKRGKLVIYELKRYKAEVPPPPADIIQRLGNKEFCSYLRIGRSWVPMKREIKTKTDLSDVNQKMGLFAKYKAYMAEQKKVPAEDVPDKYIYLPINQVMHTKLDYNPMDYDVDMMRINSIDNLNDMFKEVKDKFAQWSSLISVGVAAVVLIVVMYFSFEYGQQVISQGVQAAQGWVEPLKDIAQAMKTAPPS